MHAACTLALEKARLVPLLKDVRKILWDVSSVTPQTKWYVEQLVNEALARWERMPDENDFHP